MAIIASRRDITPSGRRAGKVADMQGSAAGHHVLDGPWLQSLPRPVFALDRDGTVVGCTPPAATLLAAAPDDLTGQPFALLALDEPDRGGFEEVLALVLTGVNWSGELRLAAGDT